MASTSLAEYLETAKHKGFNGKPRYFPLGDYVTYFANESRCYSKRINELLTIYTAPDSGDLVGIKVKGVAHILKTMEAVNVTATDGKIEISLLLLSVAAFTKQRETSDDVIRLAQQLPKRAQPPLLDLSELKRAA